MTSSKNNKNMIILTIILVLLFIKPININSFTQTCRSLIALNGFISNTPENTLGIYLIDPNEPSNIMKITDDDANYKLLGWSPDGSQLGLLNILDDVNGTEGGIPIIYNRVTNQILELDLGLNNLEVFSFSWSHDANKILLLAKDKNSANNLTYFLMETNYPDILENLIPDWNEDIIRVRWMPNREFIAFESRDEQGIDSEIFLLSIEQQRLQPTQLTNNTWNDRLGNWSHDGSQISFISDEYGNYDIYTLSLSTNIITRLTDNELLDTNPVWSYTDKYIAFIRDFNNLVILDTNSLIEQEINTISADSSYELVEFSWSPNRNALSIRESQYGTNPSEIYIYDLESEIITNISQELPTKNIMAHNWSPCFY